MKRFLAALLSALVALPAAAQMDINGELRRARFEQQASDPTGIEGRVYWNTTSKQTKVHNGTAWTTLGAGGSGGGASTNYVTNGTFEDPVVTGWSSYKDAGAATPADGTGGSPSVVGAPAHTTTSGELIAGTGSMKLYKAGNNGQGEGWSYDFSLKAKSGLFSTLNSATLHYAFAPVSGTPANGVVRVYLYDRDNATLITPIFETCGGALTASGVAEIAYTTTTCPLKMYWMSTTADDYRLIVHVADTSTSEWNLLVDEVFVGERQFGRGPDSQDLGSLTLTMAGNGSKVFTPITARGVRDAAWLYLVFYADGDATAAGAGSTLVSFSLPSGYTIDSSRVPAAAQSFGAVLGSAWTYGVETANQFDRATEIIYNSSTSFAFAQPGTNELYKQDDLNVARNMDFQGFARIPILEWVGATTAIGDNIEDCAGHDGTTLSCNAPNGSAIPTTTPTGIAESLDVTSCFANRDGPGKFFLEYKMGNLGPWLPSTSEVERLQYDGTNFIGADIRNAGGNTIYITRGKYKARTGSAAETWSLTTASSRWRVCRNRAGVTAAALATTATPGLLSTAGDQQVLGSKKFGQTTGTESGTHRVEVYDSQNGLEVHAGSTSAHFPLIVRDAAGTFMAGLDGIGRWNNVFQPHFEAYNSSAETGIASGGSTTVDFDTEVFDRPTGAANFASDTFTAPVTGNYMLCTNVDISGTSSLTSITVSMNISTALFSIIKLAGISTAGPLSAHGCIVRRMAASDTAFVTASATTSSGTWSINAGQGTTYFHGTLLH